MMIEDIGAYLQDKGMGILGENIFLGELPRRPDNCLALFEYQGRPPMQEAGTITPGLQVVARVKDNYALAEMQLRGIDSILRRIGYEENAENAGGATINDTLYLRVYPPMSGITSLGADDNGRVRLARNYYVVINDK